MYDKIGVESHGYGVRPASLVALPSTTRTTARANTSSDFEKSDFKITISKCFAIISMLSVKLREEIMICWKTVRKIKIPEARDLQRRGNELLPEEPRKLVHLRNLPATSGEATLRRLRLILKRKFILRAKLPTLETRPEKQP